MTHLAVELAVERLSVLVDQFEGVAAVTIHVAVAVRCASVREQEGHLVGCLWPQGNEVPEHVGVLSGRKHKVKSYLRSHVVIEMKVGPEQNFDI